MDVHQRLKGNLKRLRGEKGWSQEELADRSSVHRTYVSGLERAARNPTISVLERVAKAFGVTMGDLLD